MAMLVGKPENPLAFDSLACQIALSIPILALVPFALVIKLLLLLPTPKHLQMSCLFS